MTEKAIIERLQRLPFGGVISDENRLDIPYIRIVLNTFRNQIIRDFYKQNKRINPQCYQKYWPEFSADLQDVPKVVKFTCPEVISMDSNSDGFRYIGTIDCSIEFRRIRTRSMLSTINKHQLMSTNNGTYTGVLYDGSANVLEVYGNPEIEELLIEGLFSNPHDIPTFNPEKDQYPLNDDLIPFLEEMIFKAQTSVEASTPEDYRNQNSQTLTGKKR